MQRFIAYYLFSLFLLSYSLFAGEKKVLVYIASGIHAEEINRISNPMWPMMTKEKWEKGYHTAWTLCGKASSETPIEKGPLHISAATGLTMAHHGITSNGAMEKYTGTILPTFMELMGQRDPNFHSALVCGWLQDTMLHPMHGRWHCVSCQDPDVDWNSRNLYYLCNMLSWENTPDALFVLDETAVPASGKDRAQQVKLAMNHFAEALMTIQRRPSFAKEDWLVIFSSDADGALPLLVCGKRIPSGEMTDSHTLLDIAPWCLQHFGATELLQKLDGKADITTNGK